MKTIADRREYYKRWSKANRSRVSAKVIAANHRMRHQMIVAYGGKCACCGESNHRFLTLDHKFGDGALDRKTNRSGAQGVIRKLRQQGWPKDRHQLLCWNCNLSKGKGVACAHVIDPAHNWANSGN